jgi:hypothetical protein
MTDKESMTHAVGPMFSPVERDRRWDLGRSFMVNSTGVGNSVMASAPHMVKAGRGSVVLTSSYAGKKIEDVLMRHADVAAAPVIGTPHERWGRPCRRSSYAGRDQD